MSTNTQLLDQATEIKRAVGFAAVDRFVQSGMNLALGTGSTAIWSVRRVGELVRSGVLANIRVVATSFQTELECRSWGLDLRDLSDPILENRIDLAIDGADEVSPEGFLVKGGGAAHVREKITEYAAKRFIVVVDQSKLVSVLGKAFAVPIEVIPLARAQVIRALEGWKATVKLREGSGKAGPTISDNGNFILDAFFPEGLVVGKSSDPCAVEMALKSLPGVVESGIFTRKVEAVLVGKSDGTVQEIYY